MNSIKSNDLSNNSPHQNQFSYSLLSHRINNFSQQMGLSFQISPKWCASYEQPCNHGRAESMGALKDNFLHLFLDCAWQSLVLDFTTTHQIQRFKQNCFSAPFWWIKFRLRPKLLHKYFVSQINDGRQIVNPPASKARREVANLTERKNPHTPVYVVKDYFLRCC